MSRTKPKPVIENIDDANDALYQIALNQIELTKIDAAANEKITAAQKAAEIAGRACRAENEKLEESLLAFGEKKKDELFAESGKTTKAKKRALVLTFGKFGFQQSTSIEIENESEVIELIEIKNKKLAATLGLDAAIKREPKISKTDLKKFDDKVLKQFGIRRETKDTFFYETDLEAVNLDLRNSKIA